MSRQLHEKIPNLFIVGAAKAGTSSLWYYLWQHPDIFMPEDEIAKEPSYFADLDWIKDEQEYLGLFAKAGDQKYIGEASTAYLTDPTSAKRIYEFNPQAKIIILLRNPIQRAYSLYNWMVQDGYEYSPTFEEALAKETERQHKKIPNFFEPQNYYNYMYFSSGLYHEQVLRYLQIFGKENVLIGVFEDFVRDTESFLKRVFQFLEIDTDFPIQAEPKNPSITVWHPYLSFAMRSITRFIYKVLYKLKLNRFLTKDGRDFLVKIVAKNQKPKPIKVEIYEGLMKKYQGEYEKLESSFQLNLDFWRNQDKIYTTN